MKLHDIVLQFWLKNRIKTIVYTLIVIVYTITLILSGNKNDTKGNLGSVQTPIFKWTSGMRYIRPNCFLWNNILILST